ncbi:MAG TPA: DUF4832 domain-containing protein [Paludibacteraceae bacterium]|nr:DUF4832 domain-containing protein [Paludibacteraceae bacterium]HOV84427.1 DUF4832 domain-containing protein [Paludibacteraceae bacterium]
MNRLINIIIMNRLIFCVVFISFLLVSIFSCSSNSPVSDDSDEFVKVNYVISDSAIINPERGFYSHYEFSTTNSNVLTPSIVKSVRAKGNSLLLTIYYLKDFKDKPISNEFLSRLETNMKALRDGGCKCVLRFAYSSSESEKPWDAPQDIVLNHIQQITPYLIEYSDVIYVMEAGFIGVWGEWYYTTHFNMTLTTPEDYAPRRAVLDALLQALPTERMICVRTPKFKLKCFNLNYSDTITLATAFNQSDLSRIACHNDCFLASSNDVGTFSNSQERAFWEAETKYVVMGGETCGLSSYSGCDNAVLQMEKYHWSYLNSDYHPSVLNGWKTNGCMEEITKRLGYRLSLTEGKFSKNPEAGKDFEVKLKIKNTGFASPMNPRNVELIFISKSDSSQKFICQINVDPRFWFAGGQYEINIKYPLPLEMKSNEYNVYLNLPDPKSILANRPEFSIHLANNNVWDNNTGYNKIYSLKVN